jgi:hypothetical protein
MRGRRSAPSLPKLLAGWFGADILLSAISGLAGQWVANVAQLVEQRFRKARVAGSSPVVGSIFQFSIYDLRLTQLLVHVQPRKNPESRAALHQFVTL